MTTRIKPAFNENAMKVLCKRYLRPLREPADSDSGGNYRDYYDQHKCPRCGKHHETPEELLDRCSFGNDDFYNLLASLDFLPNSPTLFNAGTGQGTFSGCFAFNTEDSLTGIMDVARKAAFVQKWGGGVGYRYSDLRPKGSPIRTTHGKSCGPLAVMELDQAVARMITQGGKRDGAQIAILSCDHKDVREFIHCKDIPAECQCRNCKLAASCPRNYARVFDMFNISVAATDEFMQAASIPGSEADELFEEIVLSAWKSADPGLLFIDAVERDNPTPWLGKLDCVNPCVAPYTPILTDQGYSDIESLAGRFVNIWNGYEFSEVEVKVTGVDQEMLRIEFSDGSNLDCTLYHGFELITGSGVQRGELQRVKAEDLKAGDRLAPFTFPVIPGYKHMDNKEAYTRGVFSGDGSIETTRNRKSIWLYDKKRVLLPFLLYESSNECAQNRLFVKLPCVSIGWDKKWVPDASYDVMTRLSWLAGLLDTDAGDNGYGSGSIWSVDRDFLMKVKMMLHTLGAAAILSLGKEAGRKALPDGNGGSKEYDTRCSWRLTIAGSSMVGLIRQGLKTNRLDFSGALKANRAARQFIKVVSVTRLADKAAKVYCFTENKRHKGLFGCVATCNCGEQPLRDNEACNLGSINLAHMVQGREFNFSKLEQVTRLATRYLNVVLNHNSFPDPAITEAVAQTRKIGLGVMGWADVLTLMHIHYDSEEALTLAEKVMRTVQNSCHDESEQMAEDPDIGPYPAYNHPERSESAPKRCNAACTTIAPSGTISILAGCSSGIEPYFTLEGARAMGDGTRLEEKMRVDAGGFIPSTAHEINYEWHIKMQAVFQKYTDNAVSKTINMPKNATVDDVRKAYRMAWRTGCKGITIYRDGSKFQQIVVEKGQEGNLKTGDGSVAIPQETYITDTKFGVQRRRMPKTGPAVRHSWKVGATEGYLHVGLFPEDQTPGEIFITESNLGSTIAGLLSTISILTSMALQYGVPLETLVSKLKNINFEPKGMTSDPQIPIANSIVAYIFRFLGMQYLNGEIKQESEQQALSTGMFCEECGAPARFEEGCLVCSAGCGWSRCG